MCLFLRYPVPMKDVQSPPPPGVLVGGPKPQNRRSKRPLTRRRRIINTLGAPPALAVMRMFWGSYRFHIKGDEEIRELAAGGRPFILLFWHGELMPGAWMLQRLARKGIPITYLISPSKDGEFAVRLVNLVGGKAVRGSATRSGVAALRGLYRAISRDAESVVILPDGPRGPRRKCKEGVLLLSQLAQAPIVPMAISARPAIHLRTWDRHLLPLPLARVNFRFAPSFVVPKNEAIEVLRQRLPDLDQLLIRLGDDHSSEIPAQHNRE